MDAAKENNSRQTRNSAVTAFLNVVFFSFLKLSRCHVDILSTSHRTTDWLKGKIKNLPIMHFKREQAFQFP